MHVPRACLSVLCLPGLQQNLGSASQCWVNGIEVPSASQTQKIVRYISLFIFNLSRVKEKIRKGLRKRVSYIHFCTSVKGRSLFSFSKHDMSRVWKREMNAFCYIHKKRLTRFFFAVLSALNSFLVHFTSVLASNVFPF